MMTIRTNKSARRDPEEIRATPHLRTFFVLCALLLLILFPAALLRATRIGFECYECDFDTPNIEVQYRTLGPDGKVLAETLISDYSCKWTDPAGIFPDIFEAALFPGLPDGGVLPEGSLGEITFIPKDGWAIELSFLSLLGRGAGNGEGYHEVGFAHILDSNGEVLWRSSTWVEGEHFYCAENFCG